MPSNFQLPEQMLYSEPDTVIAGTSNFVEFAPISGSTWSAGESFKININSSNEFLDVKRSYLKFTLTLTGGSTNAATKITAVGGAAAIKSIVTTLGGTQVEQVSEYPVLLSNIYNKLPPAHRNLLAQLEAVGNPTAFSSSAGLCTNGRVVCHAMRVAVAESDKTLPLCFIRGGLSYEITLNDLANLLVDNTGVHTGFTLTAVKFVACMIKPDDSYLKSFQASLDSGNVAKIPVQLTRQIRSIPNSSTQQEQVLYTGFKKSLQSILTSTRSSTLGWASTTDAYSSFTNNNLKGVFYKVGSDRYPRNFSINCQTSATSGSVSPEALMQLECSIDNSYSSLNNPTAGSFLTDNTNWTNYYLFNGRSFGAGVPVSDGTIAINCEYNSAGPASTSVYTDHMITTDAVIKISSTMVVLDEQDI